MYIDLFTPDFGAIIRKENLEQGTVDYMHTFSHIDVNNLSVIDSITFLNPNSI